MGYLKTYPVTENDVHAKSGTKSVALIIEAHNIEVSSSDNDLTFHHVFLQSTTMSE